MGRDFLGNPADVLALASTCRGLWAILEDEIYIADVLDVKRRAGTWQSGNRCEPLPYEDEHEALAIVGAPASQDEALRGDESQKEAHTSDNASTTTRTADAATQTPQSESASAAGADTTDPRSSSGSSSSHQGSGPVARPQGRFPSESSAVWIEILGEENPQGGLHTLATKGPASAARKLIAVAARFWPRYLDLSGVYGESPVELAAWHGQSEIVRLLLDSGCAARASSDYVCWDPRPLDEIISHLTERGAAGPRVRLNPSRGDYGLSEVDRPFVTDALGLAILGGHADIAELMLERHYDEAVVRGMGGRRWKDCEGHDVVLPLHLAALAGMTPVVRALIARGADPNAGERCFHNCSPLHMASTRQGTRDAIRVLLDHGADLNGADDQARTAAQWAEAFGVEGLPAWFEELGALRTAAPAP